MTSNPAATGASSSNDEPLSARSLEASFTVADVRRSADWYRDVLGFTIDREYERDGRVLGIALRGGAIRMLLMQDDGAKGLDRQKGEGFSLQFTTTQRIDDLANRITGAGGVLDSQPADMPWGVRMFRLQDPDGFKLVFSSERPSGDSR